MARIKTTYGFYDGSNVSHSRTACGAVISHNQDHIWIGNDCLDYDTLNPIFAKTNTAWLGFGSHEKRLPRTLAVLTTKANALAPHNTAFDGEQDSYNRIHGLRPISWERNLQKANRTSLGRMFRFNDSGGNPHSIVFNCLNNSNNGSSEYVFVEGDDLSSPSNKIQGTLSNFSAVGSGIAAYMFEPVAVDTGNKVIYAYAYCTYSTRTFCTNFQMYKIPFTTIPVDGSLTLGTPVNINLGYSGNGRYMDACPSWYCGTNNAGEACFLTQIENESFYNSTVVSSAKQPSTAIKTADSHRIYFNKYNPTTGTVTTLADLKGDEGFVGDINLATTIAADHLSFYMPTHFEPSPIVGEGDIYYAYSPCFDSTTNDMGLLLFTWDKANDTFAAEATSMTFNGADVIQDFIGHCESDNVNNCLSQLNCILTKDGSNYYVTAFWSHSNADGLALNGASNFNTALTFSVNGSDFSALTYHSDVAFSPLGFAPQDDNCTKLFVIHGSEAALWSWTNAGWVKTASEAGICIGISQDQDARYWAVMQNSSDYADQPVDPNPISTTLKQYNVSLHLLSADLPASVSVEFADATITYAGSNLSKNILVNAYDTDGLRVAKSVRLKITGSNAVFTSNNSTSLTTTTSAVADTTVGLTISGAGFINISASFAI